MAASPIYDCYKSLYNEDEPKPHLVYLSPKGTTFNQKKAIEFSKLDRLVLLCGHYEGIDQRVIDEIVDEEISIGDYVLTGGEIPAMVLIDSVSRYVDGVIDNESTSEESFSNDGLLEYPQYTRPIEYEGMKVPDVLLSGNHKLIAEYRHKESLRRTYLKRPDLLEKYPLTKKDLEILEEIKKENK
jgi:tRNA (guanine37-N1)-methyltransferase